MSDLSDLWNELHTLSERMDALQLERSTLNAHLVELHKVAESIEIAKHELHTAIASAEGLLVGTDDAV